MLHITFFFIILQYIKDLNKRSKKYPKFAHIIGSLDKRTQCTHNDDKSKKGKTSMMSKQKEGNHNGKR